MNRNAIETMMGAVVLVVAAVFLYFAYTATQVHATGGYDVTARFDRVEGLRDGGDVRISGIKVGAIVSQTLDPTTFQAVVRMSIQRNIKLPVDTVAQISMSGLLGDKYMSLVPGAEEETIKPGGTIVHTQSPVSLESLIGHLIYGSGDQQKKDGAGSPPK